MAIASVYGGDVGLGADGTATSTPAVAAIEPPSNHLAGSHREPIKRNSNPGDCFSLVF